MISIIFFQSIYYSKRRIHTMGQPFIQYKSFLFLVIFFINLLEFHAASRVSTMNQMWNMWKLRNNSVLPHLFRGSDTSPFYTSRPPPAVATADEEYKQIFAERFSRLGSAVITFPSLNKYEWRGAIQKFFHQFHEV